MSVGAIGIDQGGDQLQWGIENPYVASIKRSRKSWTTKRRPGGNADRQSGSAPEAIGETLWIRQQLSNDHPATPKKAQLHAESHSKDKCARRGYLVISGYTVLPDGCKGNAGYDPEMVAL